MPAGFLSARNLRSSTELKPEDLSMYAKAEGPGPKFQENFKYQYPKPDSLPALRLYLNVGYRGLELRPLKADRMPRFKAEGQTRGRLPARCKAVARIIPRRGIKSQPGDHGECMAFPRINRDPSSAPALTKSAQVG